MALRTSYFSGMHTKSKPHQLMVLVQIGYTFLYFITEASFNHGMNPHVYVTYRHIVSTIVMFPFAYFLERKIRPKLTFALFLEISPLPLRGECDFKHVLCKLEIHFSNICRINGQHYRCTNFCYCSCTQVRDA
ncbi:hypothetical protein ACOSQ3_006985 [Xanthoceras sorbifolium]